MDDVAVVVRFNGKIKGILVLKDMAYARLLAMLYVDLNIDEMNEYISLKVNMNVPNNPFFKNRVRQRCLFFPPFEIR